VSRIVVAMSGGVDSSVVAGLLVEQGHDVIGVHMKLHDAAPGGAGHCCGLDDALDARKVADQLGIPFYVSNLREAFEQAVKQQFADDYLAGRTPNPCVQCNGVLKFRILLGRAMALGASHLATGHYCRIEGGNTLRMAVDPLKDQSYFLFPMTPKALERTLFPLGGMSKVEVRAHAERLGLVTAEKPESQDVCFLPDDDHTRFIRELHPEHEAAGEIVDEAGRVLGYHDAYYRYTVGQRRGLGVALGYPGYVVRVEPDTRRVVVAPADRLLHPGLLADRCTWMHEPAPDQVVGVRIRHRSAPQPATVQRVGEHAVQVHFLEPARAVSPGQAAVFYDGDRVLGGGWIVRPTES
jgi:tRNA-specific 2-thiouridylase